MLWDAIPLGGPLAQASDPEQLEGDWTASEFQLRGSEGQVEV